MNGIVVPMNRVFDRMRQIDVLWVENINTELSNGFIERRMKNPGYPVPLQGYTTTPKPRRLMDQSKANPVMNDSIVYFLGRHAIKMDDNTQFDNINYLVRESNYKSMGDYMEITCKFIEELETVNA